MLDGCSLDYCTSYVERWRDSTPRARHNIILIICPSLLLFLQGILGLGRIGIFLVRFIDFFLDSIVETDVIGL